MGTTEREYVAIPRPPALIPPWTVHASPTVFGDSAGRKMPQQKPTNPGVNPRSARQNGRYLSTPLPHAAAPRHELLSLLAIEAAAQLSRHVSESLPLSG